MRSDILTAVDVKNTMFLNIPSCSFINRYQHFGITCCLHLQVRRANPDDEGSMLLQNKILYQTT
jgi:hypothetical protein